MNSVLSIYCLSVYSITYVDCDANGCPLCTLNKQSWALTQILWWTQNCLQVRPKPVMKAEARRSTETHEPNLIWVRCENNFLEWSLEKCAGAAVCMWLCCLCCSSLGACLEWVQDEQHICNSGWSVGGSRRTPAGGGGLVPAAGLCRGFGGCLLQG